MPQPSQSNRMGNIEHWSAFEDGALAALDYITDEREDLDDLTMRVAEKIGADILVHRNRFRGAVEALREYGGHRDDCSALSGAPDCDCGFDEAMLRALGRLGGR